MNYDQRITGHIIRKFRQKRRITQEVLSGMAGIARSHLSAIENGQKDIQFETLWRIAQALSIRLSTLVAAIETEAEQQSASE